MIKMGQKWEEKEPKKPVRRAIIKEKNKNQKMCKK
jgi:hypothetical protein